MKCNKCVTNVVENEIVSSNIRTEWDQQRQTRTKGEEHGRVLKSGMDNDCDEYRKQKFFSKNFNSPSH